MHAYLHSLPYTAEMAAFFAFVRASKIYLAMAGIGARDAATDDAALGRILDATMTIEENPVRQREPRMMIVHKCDATLLDWICTRLATGARIDHLVLEEAFTDIPGFERGARKNKWRRLGAALGDPACGRPLRVLSLAAMDKITVADVASLSEALHAPRRTVVRTVTLARNSSVRLPSGRFVPVETLSSHEFQVVSDGVSGEWMPVRLPRKGICEVKCDDIIDATMAAAVELPGMSTLDTLDVGSADCRADAILALAQCFGRSLRQLSIHIWFDPCMSAAAWKTLLRACPRLELLAITNVRVRQLDVFSDAYHRHETRVRMLSLTNAVADDASLKRFVAHLADPSHPMALTLTQFRYLDSKLRDLNVASNRPSPSGMKGLITMLKTNRTLEFLEIGLVPALFKKYKDRLGALHNEKRPGTPIRQKLALLSVLSRSRAASEPAAPCLGLPAMSRRVAERIARNVWRFVASPVRREVSLVEITELELE